MRHWNRMAAAREPVSRLRLFMRRLRGDPLLSQRWFRRALVSQIAMRRGPDSAACLAKRKVDGGTRNFNSQAFRRLEPQEFGVRASRVYGSVGE